ncbi:MAG: DNA-binding protein [Nitrosospira multiformis]|nr:DNA-binding protein [Nitrosospira multiformis]
MKSEANQRYIPLDLETRTAIPTDAAAHFLHRKPQTLRSWASLENGPIRPIRINGRLAWSVAAIRALLNGEAQ